MDPLHVKTMLTWQLFHCCGFAPSRARSGSLFDEDRNKSPVHLSSIVNVAAKPLTSSGGQDWHGRCPLAKRNTLLSCALLLLARFTEPTETPWPVHGLCWCRENLDWLTRATNWAKFSATAGLGVIHRGHLSQVRTPPQPNRKRSLALTLTLSPSLNPDPNLGLTLTHLSQGRALMEPYLPRGTSPSVSPYSEGGALYALGMIHVDHGEGIQQFLLGAFFCCLLPSCPRVGRVCPCGLVVALEDLPCERLCWFAVYSTVLAGTQTARASSRSRQRPPHCCALDIHPWCVAPSKTPFSLPLSFSLTPFARAGWYVVCGVTDAQSRYATRATRRSSTARAWGLAWRR